MMFKKSLLLIAVFFGITIVSFAQIKLPQKENENAAPVKQNPSKAVESNAVSSGPVLTLKVTANSECKFYIDGELKSTLKKDEIAKVSLKKGEYQIKAVSSDNEADVFKAIYTVNAQDIGSEKFYEIDIQSIIKNRVGKNQQKRADEDKAEAKRKEEKAVSEGTNKKGAQEIPKTKGNGSYNLQFKITGIPDKTCKLAYYFADKQYLKDTVIAQNGVFAFKGEEELPGGIYIIILPNNQYFEMMIDKDQDFKMESDTGAYVTNMKVTGSEDNKLFYDYLRFINPKQKESKAMRDQLDSLKGKEETKEYKDLKTKLEKIDEEVKNYKIKYMNDHPETLLGKVFKTSKEVEIPEAPLLPNGKKDSTFAFHYYKSHFFDDIDFSDSRLLRTPVFYGKIRQYLDKLTVQQFDSLNVAADFLSEKARANPEVFKFIVQNITSYYEVEATKVVGLDAIFVHMVNKYYKTGQATWVDSTVMAKILKRCNTLEPLLLDKVAPNLTLPDVYTQQPFSLHDVKANYTVLYFWDPTCGHCKKVTPKLYEWYLENREKKGVAVFGVNTIVDQEEIFKYLKEKPMDWIKVWDPYNVTKFRDVYDIYKSPEMYLLDKDKKIISKHIGVEDLDPLIKMYEKQQELLKEKSSPKN